MSAPDQSEPVMELPISSFRNRTNGNIAPSIDRERKPNTRKFPQHILQPEKWQALAVPLEGVLRMCSFAGSAMAMALGGFSVWSVIDLR
jgi:hypothetical protein